MMSDPGKGDWLPRLGIPAGGSGWGPQLGTAAGIQNWCNVAGAAGFSRLTPPSDPSPYEIGGPVQGTRWPLETSAVLSEPFSLRRKREEKRGSVRPELENISEVFGNGSVSIREVLIKHSERVQ